MRLPPWGMTLPIAFWNHLACQHYAANDYWP
jgi:hypothetical protein